MPTAPQVGSTVMVSGGDDDGACGTVLRVRTDALVSLKLANGRTIDVELYHVRKKG